MITFTVFDIVLDFAQIVFVLLFYPVLDVLDCIRLFTYKYYIVIIIVFTSIH